MLAPSTGRARLVTLYVAAMLATACASESTPTELQRLDVTEPSLVQAVVLDSTPERGEHVAVRFQNTVDVAFEMNPCTAGMQRWSGHEWTDVPQEIRPCPNRTLTVPAMGELTESVPVQLVLSPGTYRLVISMYGPAGVQSHGAPSTSFELQ